MTSLRKRKLAIKRQCFGKSRYHLAIKLHRQYIEEAILFYSTAIPTAARGMKTFVYQNQDFHL